MLYSFHTWFSYISFAIVHFRMCKMRTIGVHGNKVKLLNHYIFPRMI